MQGHVTSYARSFTCAIILQAYCYFLTVAFEVPCMMCSNDMDMKPVLLIASLFKVLKFKKMLDFTRKF